MRPHPNVFHGAAVVTMAGLLTGMALKPAPKDPDPKLPEAPAAADPTPTQVARSGPTPWWVIGSDALYGRSEPQLTLARAETPAPETAETLDIRPPAITVPSAWSPAREAAYRPPQQVAQAEPPPADGEWREDADGVYFVPEDANYPREPAYDYDPYA